MADADSVGVNQALRQELLALVEQDHAVASAPDHDPNSDQVQRQRLQLLGQLRRRLVEILDTHGWPGKRLAGEDGAEAAWLLALHTMPDPKRVCCVISSRSVVEASATLRFQMACASSSNATASRRATGSSTASP
jgi:hypothetical protein